VPAEEARAVFPGEKRGLARATLGGPVHAEGGVEGEQAARRLGVVTGFAGR